MKAIPTEDDSASPGHLVSPASFVTVPSAQATSILRSLGPELVTGAAADDDPSGISTYSKIGAQFGYGLAWTVVFSFPLMAVFQAICARIGAVTGASIADNLRRHWPAWLLRLVVAPLLIANVNSLGADLGPAARLPIGGSDRLYSVLFGVAPRTWNYRDVVRACDR